MRYFLVALVLSSAPAAFAADKSWHKRLKPASFSMDSSPSQTTSASYSMPSAPVQSPARAVAQPAPAEFQAPAVQAAVSETTAPAAESARSSGRSAASGRSARSGNAPRATQRGLKGRDKPQPGFPPTHGT